MNRIPYMPMMAALSVVYLALTLWCNIISPLSFQVNGHHKDSNADEEAQIGNVARIASGHLPVFRAGDPDYEAHQPPLYYALTAPLAIAAHAMPAEQSAKILRLPSTLFGLILIWIAFLTMRVLFPRSDILAVGVAGFIALLPMNVCLSASVTNDILTNLVVAVGLWRLAWIARRAGEGTLADTWCRDAGWLGLTMGIGIWTKTSATLLFPTALFTLAMLDGRCSVKGKMLAQVCGLALGAGLLIGAPWLIRNTILYGDPVAQHIFVSAFQNTATTKAMISGSLTGAPLSPMDYWMWVAQWTFESFWYNRGVLGETAVLAAAFLAATSLVGTTLRLARDVKSLASWQQAAIGGLGALILLTLAVFVRFNTTFFQAQGRYLYPALIPIAVVTLAGFSRLFPRAWRGWAIALVLLFLFAADVATLLHLSDYYSVVTPGGTARLLSHCRESAG